MLKVGRFTASLLLVTVGCMLLMDQLFGVHSMNQLLVWWPLIFVLWGVEYIWFGMRHKDKDGKRQWKLDWLGMFVAVFIAISVFTVSQPSLFRDWVRSIQFDFSMMKEMAVGEGIPFKQPKQTHPVSTEVEQLAVRNHDGNVILRSAAVSEIEVETTVIVDGATRENAQLLADQSRTQIKELISDKKLHIEGKPARNVNNQQRVRMDIIVTVPDTLSWRTHVLSDNGDIRIEQLSGAVEAKTKNGVVQLRDIAGSVLTDTLNGDVFVKQIQGDVQATTLHGNIYMNDVGGNVTTETKNGDIEINQAERGIQAETLSGDLIVESDIIAGGWKLQTLAGDAMIRIPEDADVFIEATNLFGEIVTDFPLDIINNKAEGSLGHGAFRLSLETNGDISILKR
ncbi:DUF4097 family beta strand repeat-containing protein [Paenibacillus apiarius]|uniref:DUF4097 family beta strand repeat-containing protein n=1 Tax=Paenibacillus apiarius TaxID=46240 RepID=A0ABT4DP19_9BACL|nr:DUF4097 family beta strand repeat-containing protein [Paenibacillus apiarius]MCY9512762.1 DUF4097 family beta strand repeat-containing protein [Paenibacillus apiarius]MCY9519094.1 DUF4097 family beta strand repeat-containing protein [Paenibacillus apiarius]MCY9554718.1 DUF4097 family beta strand repeat-containing protein [Paenibacillus apiarius]MCY9559663.1 DUF4097 family beta strand repeat-containing protein [Paenibacillus apiarius]MCY9681906.1 DUF4097 family beta strand repeat-containing 